MAPHLRVLAGTSLSNMVPITDLVNTNKSHKLASALFDGEIVAHIKGMTDEQGTARDSEYFSRSDKEGVTWSIQVQGRFLVPFSSDDILFGNTFDRPLSLPWGTSAILKFMHYIDPTLEHDLTSKTKPWALSPLISTMPNFRHHQLAEDHLTQPTVPFPPVAESITDYTKDLYLAVNDTFEYDPEDLSSPSSSSSSLSSTSSNSSRGSNKSSASERLKQAFRSKKKEVVKPGTRFRSRVEREVKHLEDSGQRRAYFASEEHRKAITFGPEDVITTDFCYGFINFAPTLSLQLPGGLSFDLMRYWDGQPVRFVCCERKKNGAGDDPWGRIFWCIAIEVVDEA